MGRRIAIFFELSARTGGLLCIAKTCHVSAYHFPGYRRQIQPLQLDADVAIGEAGEIRMLLIGLALQHLGKGLLGSA